MMTDAALETQQERLSSCLRQHRSTGSGLLGDLAKAQLGHSCLITFVRHCATEAYTPCRERWRSYPCQQHQPRPQCGCHTEWGWQSGRQQPHHHPYWRCWWVCCPGRELCEALSCKLGSVNSCSPQHLHCALRQSPEPHPDAQYCRLPL